MNTILSALAELSTWLIAVAACLHLGVFLLLWGWAKRDMRVLAGTLQDYTRDLRQRSVLDPTPISPTRWKHLSLILKT